MRIFQVSITIDLKEIYMSWTDPGCSVYSYTDEIAGIDFLYFRVCTAHIPEIKTHDVQFRGVLYRIFMKHHVGLADFYRYVKAENYYRRINRMKHSGKGLYNFLWRLWDRIR